LLLVANYNKKVIKKLEQFVFYLFIFSIPFQTRLIIKQWTLEFNEWTGAFLYWTDILIGLLFLFWLIRCIRNGIRFSWKKSDYALVGFFAVSAISLFRAPIIELGAYQLLKLAEFIVLYWYIKSNVNLIFELKKSFLVLIISGLLQAVISIGQYISQANLGLKYLGETVLTPGAPGVASIIANGETFLRSYGTMPHPNVLAAFLFLAILSFYYMYFYKSGFGLNVKSMVLYIPLIFGFLFTFSRVTIFLWVAGGLTHIWLVFNRRFWLLFFKTFLRLVLITTITLIILAIFTFLFFPQVLSRFNLSMSDQDISLRLWYSGVGVDTLKQSGFLGVGTGNFVPHLMNIQQEIPLWQYQPIHNIYLLIASETGILGLGLFLLFLFLLIKEYARATNFDKLYHYSFFLIFASFLFMGIFDHFLWTLQQGRLMFWLVLALIAVTKSSVSHISLNRGVNKKTTYKKL